MPADSVFAEGLLPGLQRAVFSLCPHMARETPLVSFSSHKDTNPIMGPTLKNPPKPNHPPKALPPNTIPLGVRVSEYEFVGDTNMQSITKLNLAILLS